MVEAVAYLKQNTEHCEDSGIPATEQSARIARTVYDTSVQLQPGDSTVAKSQRKHCADGKQAPLALTKQYTAHRSAVHGKAGVQCDDRDLPYTEGTLVAMGPTWNCIPTCCNH